MVGDDLLQLGKAGRRHPAGIEHDIFARSQRIIDHICELADGLRTPDGQARLPPIAGDGVGRALDIPSLAGAGVNEFALIF